MTRDSFRPSRLVGFLQKSTLLLTFLTTGCFVQSTAAATITGVSFVGDVLDPTVTVSGSGFGTEPLATNVGYPGFTGFDYGTLLYFADNSTNPHTFSVGRDSGALGRDFIGMVVVSYTDTQVVFQFGSDYAADYYPQDVYRLNVGDSFTMVVNGGSLSGTVSFPSSISAAPEPASAWIFLTGLALVLAAAKAAKPRISVFKKVY